MWQVVLSNAATLQEIDTHWSLDDLVRCHLALELNAYLTEQEAKRGR